MNVSLTPELEKFVDNKVESGLYNNASEVVREGLRLLKEHDELRKKYAAQIERGWQLIAPPDLVANSCLFVMGSEGRGEQLLKTDQDNGLVLRDGYVCPVDLAEVCQRFSSALADFGYPTCPGNIMVSNPHWRQSVSDFSQMVRLWSVIANPDSPSRRLKINVSILVPVFRIASLLPECLETSPIRGRYVTGISIIFRSARNTSTIISGENSGPTPDRLGRMMSYVSRQMAR